MPVKLFFIFAHSWTHEFQKWIPLMDSTLWIKNGLKYINIFAIVYVAWYATGGRKKL